jgi:hypothetical protein
MPPYRASSVIANLPLGSRSCTELLAVACIAVEVDINSAEANGIFGNEPTPNGIEVSVPIIQQAGPVVQRA